MLNELQRLYDKEINFRINAFWDSGFRFELGDELNGFKTVRTFDRIDDGVLWLIKQAKKHYSEVFDDKRKT